MADQGFLFALEDLPAVKPDAHLTRLSFKARPPTKPLDAPISESQRQELFRLRDRCKMLTARLAELERVNDEAWCVFHRRLDALPEDNKGARLFATRFLVSVVRDIHNPSTPAAERELNQRWLRGEDVGGVVQAAELCSIAGVEPSRLAQDFGHKALKNK